MIIKITYAHTEYTCCSLLQKDNYNNYEMEELYSKESIVKLCDAIVRKLDDNTSGEVDNLLTILKIICCGVPGEKSLSFFLNALHPEECISCLLKIDSFQIRLKNNPCESALIARSILKLSSVSKELGNSLSTLVTFIPFDFEGKAIIIDNVLNHINADNIPVSLIENSCSVLSSLWESQVLEFYKSNIQKPDLISLDNWVNWSIRSPIIFQILTSILNQFLCVLNDKQCTFSIIKQFIKQILKKCKIHKVDIVGLYPYELQPIVSLLQTDIKSLESKYITIFKKTVSEKLEKLKLHQTLAILTHFPHWQDHLSSLCYIFELN